MLFPTVIRAKVVFFRKVATAKVVLFSKVLLFFPQQLCRCCHPTWRCFSTVALVPKVLLFSKMVLFPKLVLSPQNCVGVVNQHGLIPLSVKVVLLPKVKVVLFPSPKSCCFAKRCYSPNHAPPSGSTTGDPQRVQYLRYLNSILLRTKYPSYIQ